MNIARNALTCCLAAALSASTDAQATSFIDDFEGPTLAPFWRQVALSGSITFPSTARVHGGRQAVRFNTVNTGANKEVGLEHSFTQPTYGCVSVWFFDSGADVSTGSNYIGLIVGDAGGYVCTVSGWDYDLGPNNGGEYMYSRPGQSSVAWNSGVDRTQSWHHFAMTSSPSRFTLSIDGAVIYSGPGGFPFSHIALRMNAPYWRPAWESCFDDFAFIAPAPSTYTLFGAGCPSSAGIPTINTPAATPEIGVPFILDITSLPLTSAVFGLLGTSDTRLSNGTPLPLNLGFLGMPGCALHISNDAILFVGNRPTPDTARWTLPIPFDASLLGATFFQQVLVTDPRANGLGVVSSNAGRGLIGGCR